MLGSAGWSKMSEQAYCPKRPRRKWIAALTIVVIGFAAALPRPASSGSKDDTTGTVSKTEPAVTQDGTPAHPYADASQCPSNTDLIIWPSGRSVPSLPPGISVLLRRGSIVQGRQFGRACALALALTLLPRGDDANAGLVRRRLVRLLMRRSGENAAARY
jgi:hypothetical protein